MSDMLYARRRALRRLGALIAPSSLERSQEADVLPPRRAPRREELVNAFEYEEVARRQLPPAVFSTIAGSDRAAFDRITFRPRVNVPTLDMDLSVELFGERHFTPIIVGPVADQRRYHPQGELATVRGASAARAAVIVTGRSSPPVPEIAAQAKTPLWFSIYADADAAAQRHVQEAVAAGCRAVCITVGASLDGARAVPSTRVDWKAIERLRKGLDVPVLIKGVMTPADAKAAVEQEIQGIVVSDHHGGPSTFTGASSGAGAASRTPAPIEVLPSIADAVGGRAAVLIDGSFRRNADIVKALVFGARAVLIARPVMWALAGYGADGVQSLIEMLQSDLARNMGALGASTVSSLTRNMVRIHRR